MRYLFVANQEPLQGYTEFCNNTYLALFCETRRNGYNGFPNEYEKKEQLCLIGDVQKPSSQSEEVSFSQDYTSLGEEVSFKSNTSEITAVSLDHVTAGNIGEEMYFSPVPRTHTLIVWDRTNLVQILNGLEYSPRVVVLSELLEILTNNYINSFEYNLCIHNDDNT